MMLAQKEEPYLAIVLYHTSKKPLVKAFPVAAKLLRNSGQWLAMSSQQLLIPNWLGQNNPYTGCLEAVLRSSNKEPVYGLVPPTHSKPHYWKRDAPTIPYRGQRSTKWMVQYWKSIKEYLWVSFSFNVAMLTWWIHRLSGTQIQELSLPTCSPPTTLIRFLFLFFVFCVVLFSFSPTLGATPYRKGQIKLP